MRRLNSYLMIGLLFFYGCSLTAISKSKNIKPSNSSASEKEENKYDQAMGLAEWEFNITKDPATNTVPRQKILDALDFEAKRRNNSQTEAAISGMTWKERGPNNIGGRTRALLIDAHDATKKTVWAGAVDGGLWKTTDISQTNPIWVPFNDLFSNLSITGIAEDSASKDTMFFCTGEGWYNLDAVTGLGLWRSTDAGVNWTQISNTNANSNFYKCQKVVINKTHDLFVATGTGLWKLPSGNPSNSWTKVYPTSGSAFCADVEIAPNGRIHLSGGAAYDNGFYTYSDNNGSSWSTSASYNTLITSSHRTELAVAPGNSNYVYAVVTNTSNAAAFFLQSTDGGVAWTSKTVASNGSEFTNGQGWYNIALAVDPNTPTTVYCAGLELYQSINGGTSWTRKSSWTGSGLAYVHADNHIILFEAGSSSNFYCGNDGGVFYTNNSASTFASKNTSYNVTQYYAVAIDPTAFKNFIVAGAQDNGSHIIQSSGIGSATTATGGDGVYCHIETDEPQYIYTSYVYNNFYRSSNGGTTFPSVVGDDTGPFITAWDFDNRNNILYAAYTANNYRRYTNMHGSPTGTTVLLNASAGTVTHVKVSPNIDTTVYFGTNAGKVYKVTTANLTPSITDISSGLPGGSVSCIEIEKGNENHILVTFSNYGVNSVWESTNGGSNWTSVEGNLPDLPVRWALFSPLNNDHAVLATETGVYSTDNLNGGSTNWGINSSGMPNVRVDMLKFRATDSVVVAATHGRGIFTTDVFSTPHVIFDASVKVGYTGQSLQFNDLSYKATSWAWDFDNNGSIDATTQNPTWAYGTSGLKTVSLTINGNMTKTQTNFIQVLPNLGLPYTLAQGGNFETNASDFGGQAISGVNWERGNSSISGKSGVVSGSNAWVTGLTAANYSNNNEAYLYTPNFNLSNAANDSIKFYLKNSFENTWDGMRVEYSLNSGTTWLPLSTTTLANWYDYSNPSSDRPFPQNQAYFSGPNSSYTLKKYSLSALNGNASVAFRFAFKSDGNITAAGAAIDNFEIVSSVNTVPVQYVETTTTSKSEIFGPNATVDFYSSNGKILATLINNSSHNYGLTTVTIDNSGTGAINYSSNTAAPKRLFQKTLTIVPTTNNVNGSYTVKLYYAAAEITGWKSVTGNNFNTTNILKCPGNIASGTFANGVYGTSPSKALFGAFDSMITASFTSGFSGFGTGIDVIIVPVELINFTAVKKEADVLLNWATASEKNNLGFDIERSADAKTWSKITFVAGTGTAFNKTNYAYTDPRAFENGSLLYYRLKQQDFNGDFKYSNIEVVENSKNNVIVNITPQPAKEQLNVSTSLTHGFSYSIISNDGKEMLKGEQKTNSASIDISALPVGVYYLRIIKDSQTLSTKRFVKQ